jgi:hypothetical protein
MSWKLIPDPKDGDRVVYVGVHAVDWRPEYGRPTVAFVEDESVKETVPVNLPANAIGMVDSLAFMLLKEFITMGYPAVDPIRQVDAAYTYAEMMADRRGK